LFVFLFNCFLLTCHRSWLKIYLPKINRHTHLFFSVWIFFTKLDNTYVFSAFNFSVTVFPISRCISFALEKRQRRGATLRNKDGGKISLSFARTRTRKTAHTRGKPLAFPVTDQTRSSVRKSNKQHVKPNPFAQSQNSYQK
jgi:hypothetical protein